jgi:hypothetical protein
VFLGNVKLIIHIWRGLLLLNGGVYQTMSEIEPKSYKVSLFKFCSHSTVGISVFVYRYVVLIKISKHKIGKKKGKENITHIYFLISSVADEIL